MTETLLPEQETDAIAERAMPAPVLAAYLSGEAVPAQPRVTSPFADTGTTTFLALYMILLTFFIVLASQSQPSAARARAVLEGIRLVFPVEEQEQAPMAVVADRAEKELASLFRREIAEDGLTVTTRDGVVELSLPSHYVFESETAVLQTRRLSMLRRLAEAMERIASSGDLAVRVSLAQGADTSLGLRRAAALSRDVVRQGFAADRFEVALGAAPAGTIRFTLYRMQERAG
ncbi:MAG: hypothetical protein VYB54_08115 [Pseudomonadota bacterium]|nr:hypothetical protein [Pseudomonadota bacterium]